MALLNARVKISKRLFCINTTKKTDMKWSALRDNAAEMLDSAEHHYDQIGAILGDQDKFKPPPALELSKLLPHGRVIKDKRQSAKQNNWIGQYNWE